MPRVKAKKRGSGGGAGAEKRQRDAAGVAVKDVAMEEDDEGGLEFEDDVEDEFIEEEAMVPAEDEDEEMGAEEVMARIALDERGGGTEAQASWDPLQNVRDEGELECDARAYKMLHRLGSDWPCLSFDVIPDGDGGGRTRFPHSLLAATGTQAGASGDNRLTLLKLEGLGRMEVDDSDDDALSSDDDDDDGPPATAEHVAFPHPGAAQRVAAHAKKPGLIATWSDDGSVRVWDARDECAALCAPHRSGPRPCGLKQAKRPVARIPRDAPGYALQWSALGDARFACGGDDGVVSVFDAAPDGGNARGVATWTCEKNVEDVAFSPSEPTVLMACGAAACALRVFDARRGDRAMLALDGAHGADDVNTMAWNAAVAYLVATGGDDGVAKVWDLRAFGKDCKPVGLFDYHAKSHVASIQWDPHDESALALAAAGDADSVSLWDLSVEDDTPPGIPSGETTDFGVPPQLMFVHQGLNDPKEVKHHPQIPGLVMTTALDGFNVFIPNLAAAAP